MLFSLFFMLVSLLSTQFPPISLKFETHKIKSSIRAIEAVSDQEVWFAGSKGIFGYTDNGGKKWHIDSVMVDGSYPEFRSIAVTKNGVFILTIASPGVMLKSNDKGNSWKEVYRESDPKTFYDALDFGADHFGMAVGDPIGGCLSIIKTTDGGNTWTKLSCDIIPPSVEGEGCFAASDTNIKIIGKRVWVVSGGPVARVYTSKNMGKSWSFIDSPLIQGGKMTGIFSTDFYDNKQGFIIGGDWENQSSNNENKAVSKNGGKSWELIANGNSPSYRSCVQYIPSKKGKELFAVGIPGISYSDDGGKKWTDLGRESFYTIRIIDGKNVAWLAGSGKISRMTW